MTTLFPRIGHGIELRRAEGRLRESLIARLQDEGICLELCPTVNRVTRVVPDFQWLGGFVRLLAANDVPFCINTDNPYLVHTNLKKEHEIVGTELGEDAEPLLKLATRHAIQHRFLTA